MDPIKCPTKILDAGAAFILRNHWCMQQLNDNHRLTIDAFQRSLQIFKAGTPLTKSLRSSTI
jgi:hypothetical protein